MGVNGIIGREYEQKLIQERCESSKAELIAIYGRRRVGKTKLLRQFTTDKPDVIFFTAHETRSAAGAVSDGIGAVFQASRTQTENLV